MKGGAWAKEGRVGLQRKKALGPIQEALPENQAGWKGPKCLPWVRIILSTGHRCSTNGDHRARHQL